MTCTNQINRKDKNSVVFLWDLHEVVFQKSWRHWIKIFFSFNQKVEIFKHLSPRIIKLGFLCIAEKCRLINSPITTEELFIAAQESNNFALAELIMQICCAYTPIVQTIDIIKALHSQGYVHHIGSNIGYCAYKEFIHVYPDIFSLFSHAQVVEKNINHASFIKKPNPAYYTLHMQTYDLQPSNIIFIDDKKQNIKSAKRLGMNAIRFKNPKQLKKRLLQIGFDI